MTTSTSPSRIPAEAVEAALAALEDHVDAKECCARAALEAAAPHMNICMHDDKQGEK